MSWLRQLPLSLALLLAPPGMPLTHAQGDKIPARWAQYAGQVSLQLQTRLADDQDAAATRLHAFLDARAAATPDADPPAPVVRLWIDRHGVVSRVEFASLGDAQADRNLRQLMMLRPFGAPPRDMRQPLILRLTLAYPS
jgi:hypothetical protein